MRFEISEFEWDEKNKYKSLIKHHVTNEEAEEAFFDPYKKVKKAKYGRYAIFSRTKSGRYLMQVFELKDKGKVRIISSRDMTKKERNFYLKKR